MLVSPRKSPAAWRLIYKSPAKLRQPKPLCRLLAFHQWRFRHHGQVAGIEVETAEITQALAHRDALLGAKKLAGFPRTTFDLEGFRSGSLNEAIPICS